MSTILFLASTPLHTFFALGLMQGPFQGAEHVLALVDQPVDARDYIAEALQAAGRPRLKIVRFAPVRQARQGRAVLRQISELAAAQAPSTIAVGNDRRLEFYAALRGCPSAHCSYLDDGLYSYLPHAREDSELRQWLSSARRRIKYGVSVERPALLGGSRAVHDAYVLLPQRVHRGLAGKPVQALRPEWFAAPWVQQVCMGAAALAGFDAVRCADVRTLLLLPHPRFLGTDLALAGRLRALALAHIERGEQVALKAHPGATGIPAHRQLGLSQQGVVEIPPRLPAEVLVPLLSDTLVVSTLTTALLSMTLLGRQLTVRSIAPSSASGSAQRYNEQALDIYRSVGIRELDDAAPLSEAKGKKPPTRSLTLHLNRQPQHE